MNAPKPGDHVTFHRVTSMDPSAPIDDKPARVLSVTHVIERETPILVLEIDVDGQVETLRSVSHASTHPELAELDEAAIRAHTARRGYWT